MQTTDIEARDMYTEFVAHAITDRPELLDEDEATQLWAPLEAAYVRATEPKARQELLEAITIVAMQPPSRATRANARTALKKSWTDFTDAELGRELDRLRQLQNEDANELIGVAIDDEIAAITAEKSTPNDRTAQRIDIVLMFGSASQVQQLEKLLLEGLETTTEAAFDKWVTIIKPLEERMPQAFAEKVADHCMDLIQRHHSTPNRQSALLELFEQTVAHATHSSRTNLLNRYTKLLLDPHSATRSTAISYLGRLRRIPEADPDLRVGLGNVITEVRRDIKRAALVEYVPLLEMILQEQGLLNEYKLGDITDIAMELLSSRDPAQENAGLDLVTKMPRIPEDQKQDLLHLVRNIASGDLSDLRTKASEIIQRHSAE
jgi:hypothetical protein